MGRSVGGGDGGKGSEGGDTVRIRSPSSLLAVSEAFRPDPCVKTGERFCKVLITADMGCVFKEESEHAVVDGAKGGETMVRARPRKIEAGIRG